MKKQIIDAGDRPDFAKRKLVDALEKLHECCEEWDCTIVNPFVEKIGFAEKTSKVGEQQSSAEKSEKESFWKKLFRRATNDTAANTAAEAPQKAEQSVSDEVEEKPVQAAEKKTASSLEKYRKNIYREENLAGMEFPEKLVKYLPSPEKIVITSYGDDTSDDYIGGAVNHLRGGAYISWYSSNDDSKQAFAEAHHPFIQQFTDDVSKCAEYVLRCCSRNPTRGAVTENALLASFDMGYVNNGYCETTQYMSYGEFQHESYHDGGGSSSEDWDIYPASVTAQELESSDKYERMKIADLPGSIYCCKAIWKEGNHIYLVDPLDIPGVFEYYYYSSYCSDYDSDEEVRKCGVPYSESESFKNRSKE